MQMGFASPPLFHFNQLLKKRSSPTAIFNNYIFEFESIKINDSLFWMVRRATPFKHYMRTYLSISTRVLIDDLILSEIPYLNYLIPSLLISVKKRILSIEEGTKDEEEDNVETVLDLDSMIRNYIEGLVKRFFGGPLKQYQKTLWIEENQVVMLKPECKNVMIEAIGQLNQLTDQVSSFLLDYLRHDWLWHVQPGEQRDYFQKYFRKGKNGQITKEMQQESERIFSDLKEEISLSILRSMNLETFIASFHARLKTAFNDLLQYLHQDPSFRKWKKQVQEAVGRCKRNRVSISKGFTHEPFEVRGIDHQNVLVGMHTGEYIIEDGTSSPNYYLFPDAYVAIPLSRDDIRSRTVPPPVVVNEYIHPFLSEKGRMQRICMGNTFLGEIKEEKMHYVDRIMNMILMGVKVLREGHHNLNSNNYHHHFSSGGFRRYLIPKSELSAYRHVFTSSFKK